MSNEYAGIILKMIVWYSAGTDEGKKHLEEMERYIDTLSDRGWLTSVYKRLFKRIDEDFGRYEDICEKRRQAVAKREEYKRNQMLSNDNNSNQEITNDNKCSDLISNTNTNTNTNISNEIINKEEEEEDAREEKEKSEEPLKANDFVRIWNASIDGALKKSDTTQMKRLKVEELPSDAELRIHNALNIIERDLSEKDIERICETQKLDRNRISMRNVAKWYMVMAMKRYARVTMKSRDSSFGSFNWFVNYPLRIKKLFNGDIQ